ncbi:MAG TPA: NADH-quinone oxidoreductase subunit N [Anaerolineales bacterium]|nr:NADH-quinone oxidoreductase subunit N [Anaerolineales bacterium]
MSLSDLASNLAATMPMNIVILWACVLLLVDVFISGERKGWTALLAAIGLAAALLASLAQAGRELVVFNGMVVVDGFATFLNLLFLGSGLVGIALAYDYLKRMRIDRGEYYVLLLFSISGMMLMAVAADLIVVFLALELLSFPLYVLAGFARPRADSEESALKYFLLGAFSSSFVVYGIALVFGATGATGLEQIVTAVSAGTSNSVLLTFGAALILIGLGFKVGAVPFHMWTPDVYQGAPSSVTAFMAVGAKAGGFAAMLRVFVVALPSLSVDFTPVLWALAALTMTLGNVLAIAQSNIKRLLAYSSIAHAGYILMAVVTFGNQAAARNAVAASLFYLVGYALTNFAAWAVVIAMEKAESSGESSGLALSDYAGLGRKYPALAAVMAVAMLSFTGVPPTLGFVGKFYLFRAVLEGGFLGLALVGVLTSLISAYYYLRVVVVMYMQVGEPVARRDPWLYLTAGLAGLATVVLSIFSVPLFTWASQAVLRLF